MEAHPYPKQEEEVKCEACGRKIKVKEASIAYFMHPLTFMILPPEERRYWCKDCK